MIAMAAIAASPLAGAADIDTSLGGFVKLQYGAFDASSPGSPDQGARLDGEAHLAIDGETDTGIAYGGRLQLLRAAKPRDNGSFLHVAWAWGEFRLGDYGGAAKELTLSAPTIGIGQIDGDLDRFGGPSALIAPYKLDNDDSTRLTYLSPAILGFRLGLSYAPELAGGGVEAVPEPRVNGADRHRNVVEVALASARDIGDTTVETSATWVTGGAEAASHLHDLSGAAAGVRVIWNDLTIGGGFVFDGARVLPVDPRPGHVQIESVTSEINAGATYAAGRWSFGVSWAHDERNAMPSNDIWAAGAAYRLADGFSVAADILRFSQPAGSGLRNASALILETAAHF
jgi:hypothetical protein